MNQDASQGWSNFHDWVSSVSWSLSWIQGFLLSLSLSPPYWKSRPSATLSKSCPSSALVLRALLQFLPRLHVIVLPSGWQQQQQDTRVAREASAVGLSGKECARVPQTCEECRKKRAVNMRMLRKHDVIATQFSRNVHALSCAPSSRSARASGVSGSCVAAVIPSNKLE